MDEDDEVEAEYPLFACTAGNLFSEQQRLALLEFPLRPPWRPYATETATHVRYKPNHRMLEMRTEEKVRAPPPRPGGPCPRSHPPQEAAGCNCV